MINDINENDTVFEKILEPAMPSVEEESLKLTPHHNEKLSFKAFFRQLIFYFLRKSIPGAKVFICSLLNKGALSPELNLQQISYTAFIEAFDRFSPVLFKAVFQGQILTVSLQSVPELAVFGPLICVDGSLF
ncbi:hypothetical protein QUF90_22305, partial [Desulfococcaceae bacterium HSG9]|nr:hypothetical protein [Desulfococcaceae bacterium HSG9]